MKNMDFNIRRANYEDLDGIHNVESKSFSDPWSKSLFKVAFTDPLTEIWIAETDEIIGFMIYSKLFEVSLDNIAVLEEYRGNGIGIKFLEKLLEFSKKNEITLEVEYDNEAAKSIYEKFGFKIEGMRQDYYGKGRHAYIMWKRSI
ncbi:ribosomal protein S18-alanine N-acetyltransferase [Peptoniphilus asaccharolyticus]